MIWPSACLKLNLLERSGAFRTTAVLVYDLDSARTKKSRPFGVILYGSETIEG